MEKCKHKNTVEVTKAKLYEWPHYNYIRATIRCVDCNKLLKKG